MNDKLRPRTFYRVEDMLFIDLEDAFLRSLLKGELPIYQADDVLMEHSIRHAGTHTVQNCISATWRVISAPGTWRPVERALGAVA